MKAHRLVTPIVVHPARVGSALAALMLVAAACNNSPPEPEPRKESTNAANQDRGGQGRGALDLGNANGTRNTSRTSRTPPRMPPKREVSAKPVADVPVSPDDPAKGKFTLAEATKGLTGKGELIATIKTDLGTLECTLYEDKAPITVANFVGLARGLRPWKNPEGKWVKTAAYDGTTFHRVVKGFMIQGGDAKGNGSGDPGYVIPDEVWENAHHDERGQLCMANRGPNTNGMQFFIMDGQAPHLDGGYTIFGKCSPEDVIEKLASVPVAGDRAVNPPKIEKVTVKRNPKPAPKADEEKPAKAE